MNNAQELTEHEQYLDFAYQISIDKVKEIIPPRIKTSYTPDFKTWCSSEKGVDLFLLQRMAFLSKRKGQDNAGASVSEVVVELPMPCDFYSLQLRELKSGYDAAIERGDVMKEIASEPYDFTQTSDVAHLRLVIKRSVNKALMKGDVGAIHPDHLILVQNN